MTRWNVDGSVDTSYAGGTTKWQLDTSAASGLIALPDGKALVIGNASIYEVTIGGTWSGTTVARFNSDGSADFSYGTDGLSKPAELEHTIHRAGSAIDSSNRLYLPGGGRLYRLNPQGAVEATFANTQGEILGLALDSQERAVVIGANAQQLYLARYTASGSLDLSFAGGAGQVTVTLPRTIRALSNQAPTPPIGCALALQSNDKLVVACEVTNDADNAEFIKSDVTIARFNDDGTLDTTFGAAQADSDPYPDAFTINSNSAPHRRAYVQSDAVTITGFDAPTTVRPAQPPLTTDGRGFSIGCTGTFTTEPAMISPGQTLCVRHHASLEQGGTTVTALDVGGRYVTYTTTATSTSADVTPDAFAFGAKTNITRNIWGWADPITITGIDGLAPFVVQNGLLSIGCTGSGHSSGTVLNGQVVCAGVHTSPNPSTTTQAAISIGGVSARSRSPQRRLASPLNRSLSIVRLAWTCRPSFALTASR